MKNIFRSPMAVRPGRSPMSIYFAGYMSDGFDRRRELNQPGLSVRAAYDPGPPDTETAPTEQAVDKASLDQLADVIYELDDAGNVIPGSVTIPQPKPDSETPDGAATPQAADAPARKPRTEAGAASRKPAKKPDSQTGPKSKS